MQYHWQAGNAGLRILHPRDTFAYGAGVSVWSPDGTRIVLAGEATAGSGSDVFVYPLKDAQLTRLTDGSTAQYVSSVRWRAAE